jgi:DNA-binding CsgD family transcriptional regulator
VGPGVPPSGRRTLSETTFLQLGGPSAGGLTDQVVALGDVRRAPGRFDVRRGGSGQVADEAALALADGDDDLTARRSLEQLHALGARPAANIVARRLRERGASGLPRGPRRSTRTNPANLTARELEVLELVAQGLRNAEIAERLFLAEKTVVHHVSAILRKLDVPSRGQAGAKALRLRIVDQDG